MRTIPQQFVITRTAVIVMGISTQTTTIPQAAYAQNYQGNQSSSSDNCACDQLPASINGTIQCMRQGGCYSEEEIDGKEVKHCNFMMSNQ